MLLGGAQELAVGHHDRARRIIGEAHVQQPLAADVGRPRRVDHPVDDVRELEQRQLVGEAEGPVLRPQQRRQQQRPPLRVVMLAGIVEHLGIDHPRLDPERLLQPPPQRLRDRQRVAERLAQRFGALLQLGEMVALRPGCSRAPRFRA